MGKATPQERYWAKVDKRADGCWVWNAARDRHGYGVFQLERRARIAHQVSYEWTKGARTPGLHIDHLCRNRACVNPDHLEQVTARENQMRSPIAVTAVNAMRTVCKSGHAFTEENTMYRKSGGRACRECARAANRAWYRQKQEARAA